MSLTLSKLGANLSMNLATLSKKDMKLFETANKILDRYSNANVKIQTKQSKLKKLYELNMSLNEVYVDHRIRSTLASYFLNGTFASIPRSILTTAKQRNLYKTLIDLEEQYMACDFDDGNDDEIVVVKSPKVRFETTNKIIYI